MLTKRYIKSRKVVKVTFELPKADMPEDLTPETVHLLGEFNDWDPTATLMKRSKGSTFRTMVELEPGREYQFRYLVNGEHWCNDPQADAYIAGGLGADNCVVATPAGAGY
jgi:1,4-alpha-glucan branching enzyme